MRDRTGEKIEENREEIRPILNIIMKNLGICEDEAFLFHMESWLYVHGIATMIATNYLEWDIEFINKALTDAYLGLKHRYTGENKMHAIKTEGLTKKYKGLTAVNKLDLCISQGELFALLGVNGAGKTTAIKCSPASQSRIAAMLL